MTTVDVWRIPLVDAPSNRAALAGVLSSDERAAIERFHLPELGDRFLQLRAARRIVIARYLGTEPQLVRFDVGPHGKPTLSKAHASPLQFSTSRSTDVGMLAIASGHDVGVDVEAFRAVNDEEAIVTNYFAPGEVEAYRALPLHARNRAFITCWTRKEAYVKGIGTGLVMPLDRFEVTVDPDAPAALLRVSGSDARETRWTLTDLDAGHGYAATLAVDDADVTMRFYTCSPAVYART